MTWRLLSTSPYCVVHFCNNWGFYVLLAWLPSYFTQELGVNLTNASLFTLLPPLANIVVASFVGPLADGAIERGVPVVTVRKTAQCIAFLGPATFMVRLWALIGYPVPNEVSCRVPGRLALRNRTCTVAL
jgi:cyanate permease